MQDFLAGILSLKACPSRNPEDGETTMNPPDTAPPPSESATIEVESLDLLVSWATSAILSSANLRLTFSSRTPRQSTQLRSHPQVAHAG
jgi:hypothetical protein